MPVMSYTPTGRSKLHQVVWQLAASEDEVMADVPAPLVCASVQFTGTFGGATALLQVSNDGETWFPLKDTAGNLVSATAAAMFDISSAAAFVRARTTGGSGTAVVATLSIWVA